MRLSRVKTHARVFVGNNAVVPIGSDIPEGALIGIKSKPPANGEMQPGDTWFGSPPIKLPVRQRFDGGGKNWTYEAPRWKKYARALFEAVHTSLPTMLFIVFGTWSVDWLGPKLLDGLYWQVAALFMLTSVGASGHHDGHRDRHQMGHDGPVRARSPIRCGRGGPCGPRRSR